MAGTRILVIKQEGLRQFVEAEPAFSTIRKNHPDAPIDLLTSPLFGQLSKGAPYFDRVLAAGSFADKPAQKELAAQLKRIGYAQIYDLDGTRATLDLKGLLASRRGPKWVGPRRPILRAMSREAGGVAGGVMRKLLADADLEVDDRLPDLRWALNGRKDAATMRPEWFGISGPFALILPSESPAKHWSADAYADIAKALREEGLSSVVLGGEHLAPLAAAIADKAAEKGRTVTAAPAVIDLTGKADLAQMTMLANECAFFVGELSDTLHLCLAVGVPGVVVMSTQETGDDDGLFGRNVVKVTADHLDQIRSDTVITMLRNMGLIEKSIPQLASGGR